VNDDPSNQETDTAPAGRAPASPAGAFEQPAPVGPATAPPGWWRAPNGQWQRQAPDGHWYLADWQQASDGRWYLADWRQAPDGQWYVAGWRQPPAGQWPPPAAPPLPTPQPRQPYATWPAASSPPPTPAAARANGGQTFGTTRGLSPGQVPWHGRDVLKALFIAATPIAALTVLGTIAGGSSASQTPTSGYALAAIISTVIVDGWVLFWAWFFSLRKYRLPWASFGFRGYEQRGYWTVAAAVILGGLFATSVLSNISDYVYRRIAGPVPKENVVTIFPHTSAGLVLFVVLAVLVAPVIEETVFRGFVFQGLARSWGPLVGAVSSALIFALWHQQLSVLVPIFGLGVLLAAAFYWTRSIYTNIAFHAIFNTVGILVWWFATGK
jgi:membrane protease YdiL (CAAX protease family)